MPIQTSIKFYNQLRNGEDFSLNLGDFTGYPGNIVGNIQGKHKAVISVGVFWGSFADFSNPFKFSANTITRQYGSFIVDQFCPGDVLIIEDSTYNDGTRNIISITDLAITVDGGAFTTEETTQVALHGDTELLDIDYKYGLIENSESVNFLSKIDGSTQRFTAVNVGLSGSTTPVVGNAAGVVNSWKHGNITFAFVSKVGHIRNYSIEHEFTILPYYVDGQQPNLSTKTPPALLLGDKSLKYIFDFQNLISLQSPSTKHGGEYATQRVYGSVGWFEENFNGGANKYSIGDVSYEDVESTDEVAALQCNRKTRVTFEINDSTSLFTTSTKFILNHSYLPLEPDYKAGVASSRMYNDNFLFETKLQTVAAAPVTGTIMTNIFAILNSSSKITITADVEYSSDQQLRLDSTKQFLLSVMISKEGVSWITSNAVNLIVDYQNYIQDTDKADLFGVEDFLLYQHNEDENTASDGYTSIGAYIEDKILSKFRFWVDTSLNAFIQNLNLRIVAYNPTLDKYFELQSTSIDTSGFIVSDDIQQLYYSTTRGFLLVNGSQFNKVNIENDVMVGDKQYYKIKWAFAFNWQDYVPLSTADTIFFDNTKLNNNLNLLSSNYSNLNGYGIRIFIDAQLTDGSAITQYREISPLLKVFDYDKDEDDPTNWATTKEFKNVAGTDIGLTVLKNEKTRVKFTFVNSAFDVGPNYYGLFRLEEYQNGGLQRIHELSSIENTAPSNILIPLSGETKTKITNPASDTLVIEARINNSLIEKGKKYHISGRIGFKPIAPVGDYKQFEDDEYFEFEDDEPYEFEN